MPVTLSSSKTIRAIGAYVTREYFEYLTAGFARVHPSEQRSAIISKATIVSTLSASPAVCGIHFGYGQKAGDDVRSRTVVLLACRESRLNDVTHRILLTAKGHLTHAGERVSMACCREMLQRHVHRMSELLPSEKHAKLPRGCYFGVEMLQDFIHQPECAGIRFYFGYNPKSSLLADRYESVLEAVDSHGQNLGLFLEDSQRCPPVCPPGIL